jgi:hypothetical protein
MQEPGTFAGAHIYIGTTAAATNEASFAADTYEEITNVSNMGELGATANIVTFPVVSDKYVKKSKGTRNAGDPVLVVGRISADAGQEALRAAEDTKFYYNFKIELEDAEDEEHTNTVIYFRALVASVTNQFGGNEDFVTESYSLGIYPKPVIVESALIPSP